MIDQGLHCPTRFASGAILHHVDYEWDDAKAAANLEKHGVSFEEASSVFADPLYIDFYDPEHSAEEHRYLIVGTSRRGPPDRIVHGTRRCHSRD